MEPKNIEIELYEDGTGEIDLILDIPVSDLKKFVKKNEDFEKFTLFQFLKSNHIDPIKSEKGLFEVKYHFSSPPYRAIAFFHEGVLVILLLFKGSGSDGKLEKHISKAKLRVESWKSRK